MGKIEKVKLFEDTVMPGTINGLIENTEELDTRLKTLEDNSVADKNVINIVYPVGVYYTQYTDKNGNFIESESPSSLFGGVWQLMNYTDDEGNGITFRTEGGLASENRINGIQKDAFQGHWHTFKSNGTKRGGATGTSRPMFYGNDTLDNQVADAMTDGVNGEPRISNETRMKNILIRVYKRTA